jgi:flavin reductase (DIM6/NTAB) family NADH-FMN oxidoreductase RutF
VVPVDPGTFRRALGRFATGVTVVTAVVDGRDVALTVNAFTSVSIDPFLVLISIARGSRFHDPVMSAGTWGVSVLPADMAEASSYFASSARYDGHGHLSDWKHTRGTRTGVPLFVDALVTLECRTSATYPGGDHTLLLGEVLEIATPAPDAEPLVFFGGRYRSLSTAGAAGVEEPEGPLGPAAAGPREGTAPPGGAGAGASRVGGATVPPGRAAPAGRDAVPDSA